MFAFAVMFTVDVYCMYYVFTYVDVDVFIFEFLSLISYIVSFQNK